MVFDKINLITITCPDCNTVISIKYYGEHSNDKKFETFLCPCCACDLGTDILSAVHNAYEYNEICKKISEFQHNRLVEFDT